MTDNDFRFNCSLFMENIIYVISVTQNVFLSSILKQVN